MQRQSCCRRSLSSLLAALCCTAAPGFAQQPASEPNSAAPNPAAPSAANSSAPSATNVRAAASKPAPLAVNLVQRAPLAAKPYCGIDCLYLLIRKMGAFPGKLSTFESGFEVGPQGVSAETLVATAASSGCPLRAVTGDLDSFLANRQPAILHVQVSDSAGHYIVLLGSSRHGLAIMDPMLGVLECSQEWFHFRYKWDGFGLVPLHSRPANMLARAGSPWITLAACMAFGLAGWRVRRINISGGVGTSITATPHDQAGPNNGRTDER